MVDLRRRFPDVEGSDTAERLIGLRVAVRAPASGLGSTINFRTTLSSRIAAYR
jgi:hypothetical protein